MTIWAIVPVKPLRRGKSRLAGVLTEDERANLNRAFLENTLRATRDATSVAQTLVVSRDPAALAVAREYGAYTLLETGGQALNSALERATQVARNYAVRKVMVLPADLPLLSAGHIESFLGTRPETPPYVLIAPDRHKNGTNGLMMAPAGQISYSFGEGSFARHCDLALQSGAQVLVHESIEFGLDLDLPEDLDLYRSMQ